MCVEVILSQGVILSDHSGEARIKEGGRILVARGSNYGNAGNMEKRKGIKVMKAE